MGVYFAPIRERYTIRWREDGRQRIRRFETETRRSLWMKASGRPAEVEVGRDPPA